MAALTITRPLRSWAIEIEHAIAARPHRFSPIISITDPMSKRCHWCGRERVDRRHGERMVPR